MPCCGEQFRRPQPHLDADDRIRPQVFVQLVHEQLREPLGPAVVGDDACFALADIALENVVGQCALDKDDPILALPAVGQQAREQIANTRPVVRHQQILAVFAPEKRLVDEVQKHQFVVEALKSFQVVLLDLWPGEQTLDETLADGRALAKR